MSEVKFFRCKHCGQIIGKIKDVGVPIICCGEPMEELIAGSVDAAAEKHVPVIAVDGDIVTVKVGEVAHPMLEEHFIEWVYIKTEQGGQRKALKPGDAPEVAFALAAGDKVVAAYAYCNLHGLWKADA